LKENDVTGTRDSNGRDNYNKKMQNLKKRLFWKPRSRWEYNIKMKLNELGSKDVYWILVVHWLIT